MIIVIPVVLSSATVLGQTLRLSYQAGKSTYTSTSRQLRDPKRTLSPIQNKTNSNMLYCASSMKLCLSDNVYMQPKIHVYDNLGISLSPLLPLYIHYFDCLLTLLRLTPGLRSCISNPSPLSSHLPLRPSPLQLSLLFIPNFDPPSPRSALPSSLSASASSSKQS